MDDIKESDHPKDLINVSKDDFKHLKQDIDPFLRVIMEFHCPDAKP